jgi:hypothetical protein
MLSNTTPWPTMEDGWQLDKKKWQIETYHFIETSQIVGNYLRLRPVFNQFHHVLFFVIVIAVFQVSLFSYLPIDLLFELDQNWSGHTEIGSSSGDLNLNNILETNIGNKTISNPQIMIGLYLE